ncbi:MAG TPA: MBL fold metallo-hydrolase [Clostridiaceae bacterium]|nr:MBL fold metallo-hydrolase [Clostridiaceae bacterium]
MKRVTALILAIVVTITLFGCSQGSPQQINDLRNTTDGSLSFSDSGNSKESDSPDNDSNNSGTLGSSGSDSSSDESSNDSSDNLSDNPSDNPSVNPKGTLKVHFIDVGQADSILIQMPDNKSMLIDAGNNNDGDDVVSYIKSQGISKIDILVGTHPHEDHIGGMDTVIKSLDVGKVYMPKVSHNTKTFEDVLLAVKSKGLKVSTAQAGVVLDAGSSVKAEMLAPNGNSYKSLNNYSAVIKITFGNTSFLFTGDAEKESEIEMLEKGYNLKSTVLKVGHHGSTTSTSSEFLKAVAPVYAVISSGAGNDYGHPHQEILSRLAQANIKIYRTDESGTIIASSDGSTVSFDKAASSVKVEASPETKKQKAESPAETKTRENPPEEKTQLSSSSNNTERNTKTVYITKSGSKYHKDGCRYLSKSKIPISLSEALERNYTPCSVCGGS